MKKLIIAVDGPSSSGKSTLAKALAKRLGYVHIDTGAMYRTLTLFALQKGLIGNENAVIEQLKQVQIHFEYNPSLERNEIFLNDENVEDKIRTSEISKNVSWISSIPQVRKVLVELQQELGKNGGVTMDGRDIGTVVFPNADLKIFMIADVEVRAVRRYKELIECGEKITLEEVKQSIEKRDFLDQTREASPLIQAADAILLDNTKFTPDEQVEWALAKIHNSKL